MTYIFLNFPGSAALSASSVQPRSMPNIANMSYILKTKDQNISVPLSDPERLWTLKEFNPKLPLVMVITGWTTNFNDTENDTLDKIYAAYRCRGNVNFVVRFYYFLIIIFFNVKRIFDYFQTFFLILWADG